MPSKLSRGLPSALLTSIPLGPESCSPLAPTPTFDKEPKRLRPMFIRRSVAEAVGFEPTDPSLDHSISSSIRNSDFVRIWRKILEDAGSPKSLAGRTFSAVSPSKCLQMRRNSNPSKKCRFLGGLERIRRELSRLERKWRELLPVIACR